MTPTRRQVLVTIAASAAVPAASAQSAFLTAAETEWLKALVDTIIPRTDTPGAVDAGVPKFIDMRLAANPRLAEDFRIGMMKLESHAQSGFGVSFIGLTPKKRIE